MYQGKNPTAITSQKLILTAMNELLTEKNFKDITVSKLCCRSGVSRQTFYSLFGKTENVLLYQLDLVNDTKPHQEDDSVVTLTDTCNNYGKYITSNYSLFRMLVKNELTNTIYAQIRQSMFSCNKSFLYISDELRGYAIEFIAAGLSTLTQKYVQEHKKPDQNELARLAYEIMSGNIFNPK